MQGESYFKARIESVSFGRLVALVGLYFGSIVAFLILGAAAPTIFLNSPITETLECHTFDCDPVFYGYLNRLTPWHQVFYQEMIVDRWLDDEAQVIKDQLEADAKTNKKGFKAEQEGVLNNFGKTNIGQSYNFDLEMDILAQGEQVAGGELFNIPEGSTKAVTQKFRINCPAGKPTCDPVVIYAVEFFEYTGYHLTCTMKHPFQAAGLVDQAGFDKMKQEVMGSSYFPGDGGRPAGSSSAKNRFIPHNIKARFRMVYVNKQFTEFLMAVKYTLVVISTVVMAVLSRGLFTLVDSKYWSYEQMWVFILSIGLVAFNDPLYAIEIFMPSPLWTGLAVIGVVTLLTTLLFFWASIYDIVRMPGYWQESNTSKLGMCFYLPKMVLSGLIWLGTLGLYLFVRLQTKKDPQFYAGEKYDDYGFMKDFLAFLLALYFFYCLALILMAVFKGYTYGWPPKHFIFVFMLSVVALLVALIGLFIGAFSPEVIYAAEYTTFLGAVNSYIWVMAYAYYPADDANSGSMGGGGPAINQFHDEIEIEMTDEHNDTIDNLGDTLGKDPGSLSAPMSP